MEFQQHPKSIFFQPPRPKDENGTLSPVLVNFGLNLLSLDMSTNGVIKANLWSHLEWSDPRQKFDTQTYQVESATVPTYLIWTPDITLYNR